MAKACLILNADHNPTSCIPLSSVSWRDAIKLSYLGQVYVLETYSDWDVHSPSLTLPVPSVIVNKKYVKQKTSVRFSKHSLLLRDNFSCQYCGDYLTIGEATIDHVIPRVRGGTTKWDNTAISCFSCNSQKGHRTNIKPFTKPTKPTYHQLLNNARKLPIEIPDESWIPYIGWEPNLIRIVRPNKKFYTNINED